MKDSLVSTENEGDLKKFEGRDVIWVQTPEHTGGQYSSVCIVIYKPGARAYPSHSHPYGEETVYIISGAGKVKIGEKIFDLKPGSLALFPQGVPHMVWNNGNQPLKLCCFYAPSANAIEYEWHEEFDFPEFAQ